MAIKLRLFDQIIPVNIDAVASNLKNLLSSESVELLIFEVIDRIEKRRKLSKFDLNLVFDWYEELDDRKKATIILFLEEMVFSADVYEVVLECFAGLKQMSVISLILSIKTFRQKLSQIQIQCFGALISGKELTGLSGESIMNYVEHLRLEAGRDFTEGQKRIACANIAEADFSDSFEKSFDILCHFAARAGVQDSAVLVKFLDRQLEALIKRDESSVMAKSFRNDLGYSKYMGLVDKLKTSLDVSKLEGYKNLIRIISKFEEAVRELSSYEYVRGSFWRSQLQRLDAVKIKKFAYRKYSVGLAFFIGDFVFCDFGPTGNQIYIYDKATFLESIEVKDDWQVDNHLTYRLYPNKYPHTVNTWQLKTVELLDRARRHG